MERIISMKYKETGFRAIYRNLCVFPKSDAAKNALESFPYNEDANCVLTYGYIDQEAGLSLEILAAGMQEGEQFRFFDGNDTVSSKIRIGAVEDDEFYIIDSDELRERYESKISMLDVYAASEEIEQSREMGFLDESRDPYCVDDILVYLMKDGLQPEGCWARICGLGDHFIMGTLINEPDQNFGYHLGENIGIFVQETEDKKIICYSNMNPSRTLTEKDLEDGTMLRDAIRTFNSKRTEEHWIDVMEFLRDSYVWIPCNMVLSDVDQKEWEKRVLESKDDLDSLIGQTFTNQENIRMVPDILKNGDDFFFPVFSSAEEMGDYGSRFSKIQEHMLRAINLARNNDKELKGIVVNAFSDSFIIEMDMMDIIEKMKSRIAEDNEDVQ